MRMTSVAGKSFLLDLQEAVALHDGDVLELDDDLVGVTGLLTALVAGGGGALALFAVAWRPEPKPPTDP